ncbi:MAG: hypothetical protein K940chlam2_01200 [Chlamydiae bacterium]|nr:hypothetical protein [Chlamydiota bacterium]
MRWILFGVLLVSGQLSSLEECPSILSGEGQEQQYNEWRIKALKNWDRLLTWALSPQLQPYIAAQPTVQLSFNASFPDFEAFNKNYGYFSLVHPIVGLVTTGGADLKIAECLLDAMDREIKDLEQRSFSDDEVLAKVIAYRNLEVGTQLTLSGGEVYRVDRVIDLWRGMPAFGLVPLKKGVPILLFRGTDLTITSEKSWASILSDLDILGPGLVTFERAEDKIREWLEEVAAKYERPRAVGYSLGGNFVLYSVVHLSDLLNKKEPSIAYNPPGVSREVYAQWSEIPVEKRVPHRTYVNQGDFISYLGYFLSDVWEISLKEPMKIIEAHTTLISTQPEYEMTKINVTEENRSRGYR